MIAALVAALVTLALAVALLAHKCIEQQRWIEERAIEIAELEELLIEHNVVPPARSEPKRYPPKGDAS